MKFGSDKIALTSLYRSHCIATANVIENLGSHLLQHKNVKKHFVIEDINIDILSENSTTTNEYLSNFYEYGFQSFVNIPTRVISTNSSCIDHIFVKGTDGALNMIPIVFDVNITNHHATLLFLEDVSVALKNNDTLINKINFRKLTSEIS